VKKRSYFGVVLMALAIAGCSKPAVDGSPCNLPSTAVPDEMVGGWASGYNSLTQLIDVYNGKYLGNAWQSGKYFHFNKDGKSADFYYTASANLSSSTATKAIGTVTFNGDGTFTFHCCRAHYKGWQNGALTVDRDATEAESSKLTQTYYYSFETSGNTTWMQIRFDPQGSPTSFRNVQ